MKRGCLTALTFFLATIVVWLGFALYLIDNEPRVPSDNGGAAMGAGMFLIGWGLVFAAAAGAIAALCAWTAMGPRDP